MSDSDNYFSDSDKSENNDTLDPRNEEEVSEDDEYDEETRRIIYNATMNSTRVFDDLPSQNIIKKVKKKKKQKENKHLTLLDYEKKMEEGKPKKWNGKRFQDKKDKLGISGNAKIKKRCFNPRLPRPTYETFRVKKEVKVNVNFSSSVMFPTLDKVNKDFEV